MRNVIMTGGDVRCRLYALGGCLLARDSVGAYQLAQFIVSAGLSMEPCEAAADGSGRRERRPER